MFPAESPVNRSLSDHFLNLLSNGTPSPSLFPIAAQRVAQWAPSDARSALRAAVDNAKTPHRRRAIALAAASLKEEPTFIRRVLGEFEDNRPLLMMLEEQKFTPVKPPPEFSGL
jgi:hypothetical protein